MRHDVDVLQLCGHGERVIHGEPAPGYMVAWVEAGDRQVRFFSGDGFSVAAKELAATLLKRGIRPTVYCMLRIFDVVGTEHAPETEIIQDDWMPILNHAMVLQQKGQLFQRKPRGRPQRTFAQVKEEVARGEG